MNPDQTPFAGRRPVRVPAETRPTLSVVIHTEEEFDWGRPFDRAANTVEHMRHIDRAQGVFDAFGVVPNYVIGYPTATQPVGHALLREYATQGRALIGAHMHPWVTPPFEEEVSPRNSYPGNLPRALEGAKLETLTRAITETFGAPPRTYLAGRYGAGPNTAAVLESLGYEVDISVAACIDYRGDGGPDYTGFSSQPFWFGERRRLLGLPGTGGYSGRLRAAGRTLYPLVTRPAGRTLRLPGILSRLGLLERARLSPEDYELADLVRLTRAQLADGVRFFVFSFHSPSVDPGHTPYVRSEADLGRFLAKCRGYFEYFLGELGGRTMTPLEAKAYLEAADPATRG